jgi:predicted metallo-beta-lactamase superfamily hydrolase
VKVIPLAAESLGVRSMATYVEVGRTGILIDPGATLAPSRFGLPPAEEEWEALRRANDRISAYALRSSFVFVSHYHEDHFRSDPASYAGRRVLLKDPRRMIGGRQARRAEELWKALEGQARVESADGLQRREADLELSVSPPLPHGLDGTPFGSVVVLSPRTSRATSAIEASWPMAIGTRERSTARRLRSCIPRDTANSQPMAGLMPW